jgi:hypothetical protein
MKELTCRQFDETVHEFVRMELLDLETRDAMLEHAAHCAVCSGRMADAAALVEASEILSKSTHDLEMPRQVESVLSAAFRNHHIRAAWRRRFEWASVAAAVAVLFIVFWTMNGRSKIQQSPAPKSGVSSESREPVEAKADLGAKQQSAEAAEQANTQETGSPVNEAYAASDFVPVPFTGAISSDDPGMIVRVQLTRASLAQLGYPVAETPDEELISADILVGEDGWPRGVKLVQ